MPRTSKKAQFLRNNPNTLREIMNLLEEFTKRGTKEGKKLIYLAGGWPQDPPPSLLKEAMLEVISNEEKFSRAVQYGPTRGLTETLTAIVDYEKGIYGRDINESEILISNGSTEIALTVLEAILDEGDEVILTKPHYLNFSIQSYFVGNLNVKIKYWNLLRDDYTYGPNIEQLKELVNDKTKAIILASPGNPDGQIISDRLFNEISEIAKEKGVFLITDLAYRGFCYTEKPSYFSNAVEPHEIFICTFSKELRIPGLRLAYVIASKEMIRNFELVEQLKTLCPNGFIQKVFAEMISKEDNIKSLKEFIERGNETYQGIALMSYRYLRDKIPEFYLNEPKGAFYLFFNHSSVNPNSREFCTHLLEKVRVALAPGIDFGMDGWTRLSISPGVLNPELIKEGIERIREFIDSNQRS
ncbi:MAG TPA: pyridoxal phosphate-dependent aminotransferase [Geobacterales bacterium]|nr:pyridoxal phosphate-dependent aminotransferase [Geobacterales bacterium]